MDEETAIIDQNARNEKIKKFFIKNKSKIISCLIIIVLIIFVFFAFNEFKEKKKIDISNKFNSLVISYNSKNKDKVLNGLIEVINEKDSTYSPLSLYFIIDNKLLDNDNDVNQYFDLVINETSLEKEIKNLIIYKKALFNADKINENELLEILNPIIKSESVWKSHSLYLIAEFFFAKNQKVKSKEFFEQIISLENKNSDILNLTQKRLQRDFSE